jgi:Zn finger protein HypA/HybF involved in hydrogenase expression
MGRKNNKARECSLLRLTREDVAICLRCGKEFKSYDKTKNRICPKCEILNIKVYDKPTATFAPPSFYPSDEQ